MKFFKHHSLSLKDYLTSYEFAGVLTATFLIRLKLGHLITIGCDSVISIADSYSERCVHFTNEFARILSFAIDIVFMFFLVFTFLYLIKTYFRLLKEFSFVLTATHMLSLGLILYKVQDYYFSLNFNAPKVFNVLFTLHVSETVYAILLALFSILVVLFGYKAKNRVVNNLCYFFISIFLLLSCWIFKV